MNLAEDRDVIRDTSVRTLQRPPGYYAAHGYDKPSDWMPFDDMPFSAPGNPLSECIVTIVTYLFADFLPGYPGARPHDYESRRCAIVRQSDDPNE